MIGEYRLEEFFNVVHSSGANAAMGAIGIVADDNSVVKYMGYSFDALSFVGYIYKKP